MGGLISLVCVMVFDSSGGITKPSCFEDPTPNESTPHPSQPQHPPRISSGRSDVSFVTIVRAP